MLQSFLLKIKDHRRAQGQRYALGKVWFCAILAMLSGATSYRKLHIFMVTHYARLDEVLDLKWKRMPAHTTIRAIIQQTDAGSLESSFREYSAELAASQQQRWQIGIDGKVLRGSFDRFLEQKAIQLLDMFLSESQLILGHEEILSKTNEIPVAQTLLEALGLQGCLFTFDALHCQAETLKSAKATGNEVVVQVKANQKTLLTDCQTIAASQAAAEVYQEPFSKAHNRIEARRVSLFLAPPLTDALKWEPVQAVIKVERHRQTLQTKTKAWKESHETAFYIATTQLSAPDFAQVIRQRWDTENRHHYVRDVTLGEDRSRIRINPDRFARLRSFALNLLRHNHVVNVSQALFENALNLDNLLLYNGIF
jgi:predicted transposase YbfD/YdcC